MVRYMIRCISAVYTAYVQMLFATEDQDGN